MTPRKVGVGLKRRREPSRRRLGCRLACWGSTEKKEALHLLTFLLSINPIHPVMFLAVSLPLLLSIHLLNRSEFFNGMPKVFEPKPANFSLEPGAADFGFNLRILSVFRSPILIHLSLSSFLNSLLCDLIALTSGLAFFLSLALPVLHSLPVWYSSPDDQHASDGVIAFVRHHPFFFKLFATSLFLLDPYSDYARVKILLNNFLTPFP